MALVRRRRLFAAGTLGAGIAGRAPAIGPGARRLYERCGYGALAARPMVKDDWVNDGNNWVLLTKQL